MASFVFDVTKEKLSEKCFFDGIEIHVLDGSATIEVCLTRGGEIVHVYPEYKVAAPASLGNVEKAHD
jgi:hypothetical protein